MPLKREAADTRHAPREAATPDICFGLSPNAAPATRLPEAYMMTADWFHAAEKLTRSHIAGLQGAGRDGSVSRMFISAVMMKAT